MTLERRGWEVVEDIVIEAELGTVGEQVDVGANWRRVVISSEPWCPVPPIWPDFWPAV